MADDQRRCCILGLCCPPGSAAQRRALEEWLLEKLADMSDGDFGPGKTANMAGAWLDELPWKKD